MPKDVWTLALAWRASPAGAPAESYAEILEAPR